MVRSMKAAAGTMRAVAAGAPASPTAWRSGVSEAVSVMVSMRAAAVLAIALAGCASGPQRPGAAAKPSAPFATDRDGPGTNPPPDLARVPDAEPKLEPIRIGGPNKPYELLGKGYVPITQDAPFTERGLASWYGRKFHGRPTASGEVYDMYAMTAAHPTLPIPSYARIRNPANGREVLVRVNDRGPFHPGRIVDLSYTAALKLDMLRGVAPVELQRLTFDDIRTGAWRRREGDAIGAPGSTMLAKAAGEPVAAGAPAALETRAAEVPLAASAVAVPSAVPVTPMANSPVANTPAPVIASTPASMVSPVAVPAVGVGFVAASAGEAAAAASLVSPPTANAPAARAFTEPARGFWVQLGAFKARAGAEDFRQRVGAEMDWLSPLLAVFGDASMYRLQAGPYPNRDEARSVAERVRGGLQLVPVIVERR
jgi:rare lipoprotein A